MESESKLSAETSLRINRAKLAQLFQRIQRTYDLIKDISNVKIAKQFLTLHRLIPNTVLEYDSTELLINQLELSLNESFTPVFNDSYLELVSRIYETAEAITKKAEPPPARPAQSAQVQPTVSNELFIPKIEISKFSGRQSDWAVFYELFKSIVHENKSLSEQQKVQILASKLTGEALNIAKHLPAIGDNYSIIWNALVSRYNNPRVQLDTYLNEILQFKGLKVESREGLTSILDKFCNSITAVKRLKTDGLDDAIFLHLALRVVDPVTRKEFESAHRDIESPTYQNFVSFIEKQIRSFPMDKSRSEGSNSQLHNKNKGDNSHSNFGKLSKSPSNSKNFAIHSGDNVISDSRMKSQCPICKGSRHKLTDCESFLKLSPWDRFRLIKDNSHCLKCLMENHAARECKSKVNCAQCKKPHHTLLHFNFQNKSTEEGGVSCCSRLVMSESENKNTTVLLSTAIVLVKNRRGQECRLRLLLDSGSEKNFITVRACKRLGLFVRPLFTSVTGFGGHASTIQGQTEFTFHSRIDSGISFAVQSLVVKKCIDFLPSHPIDISELSHLKSVKLADDNFHIPGELDGILGAEFFPDLIDSCQSHQKVGSVKLVESKLGCIVMGRAPILESSQNSHSDNCLLVCGPSLNDLVQRFWEVESCPQFENNLTPAELDCENKFQSSARRLDSGRFVVPLPFEKSADCLGDSYAMAKRRLLNLEKRLARSKDTKIAYHEIMLDYLRQGHMTLIKDQKNSQGYYIPHHAIVKARSTSTPVRIVYDASAKTTSGWSLNSILHVGQKLQTDIFVLLVNFRLFSIAVTADLKQMYRQIFVSESCRKFQRVLWRFSLEDPIEIYEINCVVFGITSSPYLALRTVHQLVKEEGEKFPDAAARIPQDMFMDDLVTSVPTVSDASKLCHQAKKLFEAGGFELTKFASNSVELMSEFTEKEKSSLSKEFDSENSLAILGLEWQPFVDSFRFFVKQDHSIATKRNILSAVARIFDPLGLLAPLTLFLKCLIQELWHNGSDWDEEPPNSIASQWEICKREFQFLSNLSIPRHLGVFIDSIITLIGFCDASESGYGAVIYLKSQKVDCDSSTIVLLCGKSKVAPNKTISIPRLELCAALLLAKLLESVVSVLDLRCKIVRIVALSDSTVTLCWIRGSPSRWQTFVANRVTKIQNSRIDCWMHVAGEENPADCVSRGLTPFNLINHKLWWSGPTWLTLGEDRWPVTVEIEEMECPPETKSSKVLTVVQSENSSDNVIYNLIERCSDYQLLLHIIVFVLKMLRILPKAGEVDFDVAEKYLCRVVQRIHFSHEFSELEKGKDCTPKFQRLSPFLDDNLIRVGGRLKNSELDFDSCHPIVLPNSDPFVTLLIDYYHRKNCHAGPRLLMSLIRQKFWIFSARVVIRGRIRKCNRCFRCRPGVVPPKMGDLPSCRVLQCKPFEQCGVDYGGPVRITMARRRNPLILKAYICLFVCMSTKAVHIELVSDLSTPMFLSAFRRFLSRRGPCRVIYSDNGTNFVGAHAQLIQLSKLLDSSEFQTTIANELADYRIDWKFIPAASPNFGGLWESNIKSVKSHLIKVIGTQLLTYEEMNTVLVQVEAVLNSRPLCPLSDDPNEPLALTPAHFLKLTPLTAFPMKDVTDIPVNRLTRYELVDQLVQSFWNRWRKEYLHELQVRGKWSKSSPPLTVGTVVIVDQPNLPPLKWPLGIIEEVFPGGDGIVRVAVVRLVAGRFKRPVTKLFPLPTQ